MLIRIANIILILVYLTTSVGWVGVKHICLQKNAQRTACKTLALSKCCCKKSKQLKPCCKNKIQYAKLTIEQTEQIKSDKAILHYVDILEPLPLYRFVTILPQIKSVDALDNSVVIYNKKHPPSCALYLQYGALKLGAC